MGLNEIQLQLGKVIKTRHSPIITEEECGPSRGDARGSEVATKPTTTDKEEEVTFVTVDLRRIVTAIIANSGKADTPVTTDSTVLM